MVLYDNLRDSDKSFETTLLFWIKINVLLMLLTIQLKTDEAQEPLPYKNTSSSSQQFTGAIKVFQIIAGGGTIISQSLLWTLFGQPISLLVPFYACVAFDINLHKIWIVSSYY